jgi:fatty acid desaturase
LTKSFVSSEFQRKLASAIEALRVRNQGTIVQKTRSLEWPTLVMLGTCYALWLFGLSLWEGLPVLAVLLTGVAITLHSSLQHEVLHGHPFRAQWLNEALVFPALSVFVSYVRFKDTHLQHHCDPNLTDPYDDPESNYLDPAVWAQMSRPMQLVYQANNTLAGRIVLGPLIGTVIFLAQDFRRLLRGEPRVWMAYGLHAGGVVLALGVVIWFGMPVWAYLLAAYLGSALLKIRTFLEHRAHDLTRARTVIVEDRGPLSYLFLNNNFHVVHHCMPKVAWYDLPRLYATRPEHFSRRNESYVYRSYGQIFRQYLFRAKDPVPHPIWPVNKRAD